MFLQFLQTLLGLLERLFGLAQSTEDDQGIPLGQVMTQVKQIRNARAAKTRVGQLDQRLGTVAHHVQDRRAKRRQALVRAVEPGVITSIRCHLFHPHLTRRQVHEYQHHLLQKGLIHRPNDWAYLAMGDAVLFPSRSDFQDETLQQVHQRSQGVGSSPSLRPDLSLSTPSHYALSTIVFISKTIRHPLNQLDLVVESFRYTVAVTIPDIVDNRLKPTRQRPGQPFQWLLRACARALNQLQERLTGWLFILVLEPQPQVLNPVDHLAQLRKATAPLVTRD